jgi:hypothetical protein
MQLSRSESYTNDVAVANANRSSDSGLEQDNRDESQGWWSLWTIEKVAFWHDSPFLRKMSQWAQEELLRWTWVRVYHVAERLRVSRSK